MAFNYTNIVNQIVARLTTYLPTGYQVIRMPEKENEFKIGKDKVLILVAYADSNFGDTSSIDILNQSENVTVLCNIKSPRLYDEFSIDSALQLLKVLLIGFKPNHLSKLTAAKIEFDERNANDNFFSYNFTLTGKKKNVEVVEDEVLPLLKKLSFNSAGDFYHEDFIEGDFLTSSPWFEINSNT